MVYELVYLGHDNVISLLLTSNNVAIDLANITKMTIVVGDTLVTSTNQAADPILWNQVGYPTGKVTLKLGLQDIVAGIYERCYLTIYDVNNPEGIVWDALKLEVVNNVEST